MVWNCYLAITGLTEKYYSFQYISQLLSTQMLYQYSSIVIIKWHCCCKAARMEAQTTAYNMW